MPRDHAILETIRRAQQLLPDAERPLYDFYLRLLAALQQQRAALPEPPAPPDVKARLAAGQPALSWGDLGVEEAPFRAWVERLAALVETTDEGLRDELEALEPEEWLPLARRCFERGESGAGPTIDALLGNALTPHLERAAAALDGALPANWPHATCPACGGYPNFAVVDDRRRRRRLTCERCATTWRYDGLACLFCGERRAERFGYFSSEDNLYRVEVCDSCGHYLKAMAASEAAARGIAPLAEAERVLTPGLDLTAIEAGYERPTALPGSEAADG